MKPKVPVFEGIMQAIARQRLAPGMKLNEEAIGEVFGVSRTKVRAALLQLAARGLVTIGNKRTARVATPSVKEARNVFAVRKLVEPVVAAEIARSVTPELLRILRRFHKDEHRARASGDRIEATRLAGEFHAVLARHGSNALFTEIVEKTVDQTFLIAVLYQAPSSPACVHDEHEAIIGAIEKGDATAAAKAMREHIAGIESRMLLDETLKPAPDIKSAFAGVV